MNQFDSQGGHTDSTFDNKMNKKSNMSNNFESTEDDFQKIYDSFDIPNCILMVIFKIFSIVLYILLKILTNSYLGTFIGTVLLVCLDFWATKNITGRKLVGLRWWNQINEDDGEEWVFQSRNPNRVAHSANESIFWFSQLIYSLFWTVMLIINMFSLELFWIGLGLFTTLLPFINFVCYFKCRGEHQKKAGAITRKFGINMDSHLF